MKATELIQSAIDGKVSIYKALSYRWDCDQTPNPIISDESYHLDEDEAIEAADAIDLEIGYEAHVDMVVIDIKDIGEEEEMELREWFKGCEVDTIHYGDTNYGKDLDPESIVVTYQHHRYMNYAYNIIRVERVKDTKLECEADLVDNSDSTSTEYIAHYDNLNDLANSLESGSGIFGKINKGRGIVVEFLESEKHPNYSTEEEEETEDY